MSRWLTSRVEKSFWLAVAMLVPVLVVFGTLSPWPTAAEKLAPFSKGPYIPLSFSYRSHASGASIETHRSQTYFVPSLNFSSLSTFRVQESNSVVTVEEVEFGLVYSVLFLVVVYAGIAWRVLLLGRK